MAAGSWLVANLKDQREEDALALCFDSEPLTERLEILGAPEVRLVVASDRPAAFLVARLCDVAPDGSSTRVSHGALNLTHRAGHDSWQPLEPGRPVEANLRRVREEYTWPRVLAPLVAFAADPRPAADRVASGAATTERPNRRTPVRRRRHGVRHDVGLFFHYLKVGGPSVVVAKVKSRLRRRRS